MLSSRQRRFLLATADFWFCPTTGKIILGLQWDDKVMCGCGKPNPKVARYESGRGMIGTYYGFIGCHIKAFLEAADVDAYEAQEGRKEEETRHDGEEIRPGQ
jgi:hypothetical protein